MDDPRRIVLDPDDDLALIDPLEIDEDDGSG